MLGMLFVARPGAGEFGWLAFAEIPDAWTVCGTALVVAGGLYAMYRERDRERNRGRIRP